MTSTARSSGGHDRSGATEHARPLQRLASDGNSYTEDEFAEWYGEEYRDMWDSASGITMSIPSGQGPQAGAIEHSAPATQCLDEFDPWKELVQACRAIVVSSCEGLESIPGQAVERSFWSDSVLCITNRW